MRVYHFNHADHALENVVRRRLKIATLQDINDPFELAVCFDDAASRGLLRRFRQKWAERYGMLCFSRSWRNPVQWSHYADRHRGVCLGFDMPADKLVPVRYAASPVVPDWTAVAEEDNRAHEEMIRWSSTKYRHWRYEEELRAFVRLKAPDDRGLHFCNFSDDLKLREIIVGPESDVSRADVAAALAKEDVQSFKARLAFRSYRVVRQRRSDMWR